MQLTKLDRWLKERFIYETHVFTMRLPEQALPRGVRIKNIDSQKARDYQYKLVIKNNKLADEVVAILKQNKLIYSTHIVEGNHWYNQRIAPKGKSFTYQWILRFLALILFGIAGWGLFQILDNPEVRATLKDAWREISSGT